MNQQCITHLEELEEQESNYGKVLNIDGPLIVAEKMASAEIFEIVKIGQKKLIGEIIKLKEDIAFIQCFEDTSGLSVDDQVLRTRSPFCVELGPGLFTQVFDGIQRRLQMNQDESFIYSPIDINRSTLLDQDKIWEFKPSSNIQEGKMISGGDIYGSVFENNLFNEHRILVDPKVQGRVTYIATQGNYTLKDKVLEVEIDGIKHQYGMSHFWPVRQERPVFEKLQGNTPLLTGIRVLDGLYPTVLGGTCCASVFSIGGKHFISQAIAKYSNFDCNIYVGCGENESDIFKVLEELREQTIPIKGQEEIITQRTCLIANSSKMVVPTSEISVFTGITIAEYFRDMGYNVSLMVDSTNQWTNIVNEIQQKLGEMPSLETYSQCMTTKLGQFYNRAGRVQCIGSPERIGTITIVGIATQSEGDWSNPATDSTLNNSKVLWLLDKRLSKRKHCSTFDWISSNSNYEQQLDPYFISIYPEFQQIKAIFKQILNEESEMIKINQLQEITLSEDQLLTLDMALIIREQFLYQNTFNSYDKNCPLLKTIGIMKCIVTFYECAQKAILESSQDQNITWNQIQKKTKDLLLQLNQLQFYNVKTEQQETQNYFTNLADKIQLAFKNLNEE